MKKPPEGWPRVCPAIFYDDGIAALDWLVEAFGFEIKVKIEGEGGRLEHAQLAFGDDGLVMVGTAGGRPERPFPSKSPRSIDGANTQTLMLFVDDADAHCEHARAAGAKIVDEPMTQDYGEDWWSDRTYRAEDLEGHQWWFTQRLRG